MKVEKEFIDFLIHSKQNTYASGKDGEKTIDGGETYVIEKGKYKYIDTYFGSLIDSGQERVFENGKVIWVMAYRGGACNGMEKYSKEAFELLKKCLSVIPVDFPARGPAHMEDEDWVYENNWKGDIKGFVGEEGIYFKGKKVCFRNYLGGVVKS